MIDELKKYTGSGNSGKIIIPDWQLRIWVADDRMIKLNNIFKWKKLK
jgi:hypothetical protein